MIEEFYPDGKKKKEVYDMTKNGQPFKLIINYDEEGNVISIMEKPNLKLLKECVIASGAHVFTDPTQNHVDFFISGAFAFKEYPKGFNNYGYEINGGEVTI